MADGSEQAFAILVRACWKHVYAHALSWLKTTAEAEELTQDVFLDVWKSRALLPELDSFRNWLFIIARNRIVTGVRRKVNQPAFVEEQEKEAAALQPDQWTEQRQHYRILLDGIALLPEKRQEVFRMSRLEGLTHEQIAERLGIHKDTVAQYIVKAVTFLKIYLQEQLGNSLLVIILLGGFF